MSNGFGLSPIAEVEARSDGFGLTQQAGPAAPPEGDFDATVSVSPTTIEPGDGFSISVTVENVGSQAATEEFAVDWDGFNLCVHFGIGTLLDNPCLAYPGEVAPGESFTMSIDVPGSATGDVFDGDHTVSVRQNLSGGESPTIGTETVTVEGGKPGDGEIETGEVTLDCSQFTDDEIEVGQDTTIPVTIENGNEESLEVEVSILADDDLIANDTVSVAGNSSRSATLTGGGQLDAGTYSLVAWPGAITGAVPAASKDSCGTLTVSEAEEPPPENGNGGNGDEPPPENGNGDEPPPDDGNGGGGGDGNEELVRTLAVGGAGLAGLGAVVLGR